MKLPKKYEGITPGEWKPHATGHARSGKPEHEIHWSKDGECVAEIVHGEKEATIMADSKRLAAAVVELRDSMSVLLQNWPKYRDGMDWEILPAGVINARNVMDKTAEWEA